ncbi:tyrosine-type recombinase/integrase [Parasphingopyxis sp. CP4]|uniref:tyrosine-type recombinase/integrase n=1 Tax=Parasphingopyxis sp. CP4 TaxID=2724527 RepID=UPI0015A4CA98|nr:site-specific integrase [Parasphingopyxis sp. CP4]QLC21219.1 tyrosine-type recombinase/integrase [Parasphingopyxis sp. CP4]
MNAPVQLTDPKIKGTKSPVTGQIEIRDATVPGLRLRVGKSGSKSFIVRKRANGKWVNKTIGRYGPRLSLAEARRRARAILSDLEAGKHVATTKGRTGPQTIAQLWPGYAESKSHLRSFSEIERVFIREILPEIGERVADTVTRSDITRLIDLKARSAPTMARAIHAQLSSFYSWAMPRLDRLPANPCRDAGRPPKPASRTRVLSDEELVALWRHAEREPMPWRGALKLMVLTGQRRGEVFDADCNEFDLEERLWTIPAPRAKNGAAHLVPLSGAAMEVVDEVPRSDSSGKLFPAKGNLASSASGISKAVRRARESVETAVGDVDHWTLHDIRRTVATGLQKLGVRLEVTEAVLNHVSGSRGGIVGVYQRHDFLTEKRAALELWAEYCSNLFHQEEDGNG